MKLFIFLIIFNIIVVQVVNAGVFLEPLEGAENIYRSRAPKISEIPKLISIGISEVIILKNQTKSEVDDEITALLAAGFTRDKIHHIPLEWKNVKSELLACEQILQGLQLLLRAHNENEKVLFHCTAGEDRTGLLAGLVTQIMGIENTETSFAKRMCDKGYAAGNIKKPKQVSLQIDKHLTPLFYKISKFIENGMLTSENISANLCKKITNEKNVVEITTCDDL